MSTVNSNFLIMESGKEKYTVLNKIGEGAYGSVYRAVNSKNEQVALKKIVINPRQGINIQLVNEICALRVLESPNIVHLFDVINLSDCVVLIMEYLACNLQNIIEDKRVKLDIARIKTYSTMMLQGISFMHSKKIMHRDLKPANLLIATNGLLKIGDLGLAAIYNKDNPRKYSSAVATRWYRAPELLYGSTTYTPSIDMWSFGCIFGELINRMPLFRGDSDILQLALVLESLGAPTDETWPDLKQLPDYHKIYFEPKPKRSWSEIIPTADAITVNFIDTILIYDSKKRLTAELALKHNFFSQEPLPVELKDMPKPNAVSKTKILPKTL